MRESLFNWILFRCCSDVWFLLTQQHTTDITACAVTLFFAAVSCLVSCKNKHEAFSLERLQVVHWSILAEKYELQGNVCLHWNIWNCSIFFPFPFLLQAFGHSFSIAMMRNQPAIETPKQGDVHIQSSIQPKPSLLSLARNFLGVRPAVAWFYVILISAKSYIAKVLYTKNTAMEVAAEQMVSDSW